MKLLDEDQFVQAEEILRELIRIAPHYSGSYWVLGTLPNLKKLHGCDGPNDTPENQLLFLRKAVELAPEKAHYQASLGSHLVRSGYLSEGREVLRTAYRIDPTPILMELQEMESALPKLSTTHNAFYMYCLSVLYELVGREDEAIALKERVYGGNLQVDLLIAGKTDEAERVCREMLENDPENAAAWMGLGGVMNNRREWKEAEGYYKKALDILYEFPHAWIGLAVCLKEQGRGDEAEEAKRKSEEFEWNTLFLEGTDRALICHKCGKEHKTNRSVCIRCGASLG